MRLKIVLPIMILAGAAGAIYFAGGANKLMSAYEEMTMPKAGPVPSVPSPAVSAAQVKMHEFVETVLITGSLVPRDEIVIAPEVEGLRIVEIRADEGDHVKEGDVLAVLERETLLAQIAQKDAAIARADAAIAQAKSQIAEAEARLAQSEAALARAIPLNKSKYLAESVLDERRAAAQTDRAKLRSGRDGLTLAEASKNEIIAQKRELEFRLRKTEIKAPVDGVVSGRNARIGEIAIGAILIGAGDPMFSIIARGEIELDAEVPETKVAQIRQGQPAAVDVAGAGKVNGKVRLVSPAVDKTTRMGRVRIFLGDDPRLHTGAFARGKIETRRAKGPAVPLSAVMYSGQSANVLVIKDNKVHSRNIETGLSAGGLIEVRSGVEVGDVVVAKSGTFLRDGDAVRPVVQEPKLSETR